MSNEMRYPTDYLFSLDNGKTFSPITVWKQEVADDLASLVDLLGSEGVEDAAFYEDLGYHILFWAS